MFVTRCYKVLQRCYTSFENVTNKKKGCLWRMFPTICDSNSWKGNSKVTYGFVNATNEHNVIIDYLNWIVISILLSEVEVLTYFRQQVNCEFSLICQGSTNIKTYVLFQLKQVVLVFSIYHVLTVKETTLAIAEFKLMEMQLYLVTFNRLVTSCNIL